MRVGLVLKAVTKGGNISLVLSLQRGFVATNPCIGRVKSLKSVIGESCARFMQRNLVRRRPPDLIFHASSFGTYLAFSKSHRLAFRSYEIRRAPLFNQYPARFQDLKHMSDISKSQLKDREFGE